MRIGLAFASVLFGILFTGASAFADDNFNAFTTTNVSAALQTVGATNVVPGSDNEGPFVDYELLGRKYRAALHLCKGDGCSGLELICSFHGVTIPLEALNKFNVDRVFAKAIRTQDQVFRSERYLIADGGTSPSKLAAEIQVHVEVTDYLLEMLRGAQLISSVNGPAHTTLSVAAPGQPAMAPRLSHGQARASAVEPFSNLVTR